MATHFSRIRFDFLVGALLVLTGVSVWGQNLRYDNHREVAIPEYATIQLGPFHSSWAFLLRAGYRYVETTGAGTDFLFAGSRGRVKKDGAEYPVIVGLDMRNYLVIGPHTDLDVSLGLRYEYYPLDTQESEFRVFLPGEGINANLSMELSPVPYLRMRLWDAFGWQMDYLDTRGLDDRYGGQRFENISNTIGLDGDLLLAERQNLGFGASRGDRWALDDEWEHQSRVTHSGYLLYEYELAEYMILGFRTGLSHIDYPESERADTMINDYRADLTTLLTERTTVNIFGGYAMGTVSGISNSMEEVNTTLYGGSLQTRLSPDLQHGLSYAHGLRGGYTSSLEEFDLLRYDIRLTGEFSRWNAYTGWQTRDPSSMNVSGYTDWTSGLLCEIPILPAVSLVGSIRYSERSNDDKAVALGDPELSGDYDTWAYKIGSVVRLADELDLSASAEHIERDGDNDELDYTRDIVSVLLTYRHEL
ncbi:MAG: hypothetical protein QGH42_02900 [Kiritimatiellia bacterium]|jgi:hypothetical protein|nr:hypothetical protein [Kiritimatiellia bacterium]MDP6631405.1 hypothetical protein [Kiritimatiellia bacterium]MDP6809122.1 hypothetical protein [Kiritimatiellia bacterium]MDP7023186.1 hypothetical protein [Kiritimatiellia bacterium]